ncbi:MAG TPA: hypothetical protein VKE25_09620 [Actinomycetes bacterium]|nr:hypothetical protein [Actinomycetes bacterium]
MRVRRAPARIRLAVLTLAAATVAVLALATPAVQAAPRTQAASGPVLFLGIPGLRWTDVSAVDTPTLYGLLERGSVASLSVRTVLQVTCPADGWLTVGAGARALVPRETSGQCPPIEVTAGPEQGAAVVSNYAAIASANEPYSYDPVLGLLASQLRTGGRCATAVRPGAALALGDASGRVESYRPDLATVDHAVLADCPLTMVDLGALPAGDTRPAAVRDADRAAATLISELPAGATVIVGGIAESGPVPHLGALLISGPDYPRGWLTATSTRQDGLVQLTDLTPTLLHLLGLPKPAEATGAVIRSTGGRPTDSAVAIDRLRQADRAAQVISSSGGWIFGALEGGQYLLYLLIGAIALWRARSGRRWQPAVRGLGLLALFFGAVPAAGYLVNLLPWRQAGQPAAALLLWLGAVAFILAALAAAGPWRRHPLGPSAVLATITFAVLGVDVIAGSHLQISSLFGLNPLVAGRFYGIGNIAFAVFAMAALFTATIAASYLLRVGRPAVAGLVVAGIGLVAVVIDGWQAWGADFGGVIAIVPGFALLGMAVMQVRLTPVRALGIAAGTVVAVAVLATLDWLRPADQRSHLGRFVQQVLDGEAGDVVVRKADAMLTSLTRGPEGVLVPIAMILVAVAVSRPDRFRLAWLSELYRWAPVLQAGLVAMVATAVLAALVNDSGVQVPAVCLAAAVPWVLAACAREGLTSER